MGKALRSLRLADDDRAAVAAAPELHAAVTRREDRVVAAEPGSGPRPETGSTLAHQDHPGANLLPVVDLHPEPFRLRVAAVPGRAKSFFVSHLRRFLCFRRCALRLGRRPLLLLRRRGRRRPLRADRLDLDLRQLAAVAGVAAIARAPAVLANSDLLALDM